jgi:hypothetical protein
MQKLQAMFTRLEPTAYMFGHVHNLQYAEDNGVSYIQSGAGAVFNDAPFPWPDWRISHKPPMFTYTGSLWFVSARLDFEKQVAEFDFVDWNGVVHYTAKASGRSTSPLKNSARYAF